MTHLYESFIFSLSTTNSSKTVDGKFGHCMVYESIGDCDEARVEIKEEREKKDSPLRLSLHFSN